MNFFFCFSTSRLLLLFLSCWWRSSWSSWSLTWCCAGPRCVSRCPRRCWSSGPPGAPGLPESRWGWPVHTGWTTSQSGCAGGCSSPLSGWPWSRRGCSRRCPRLRCWTEPCPGSAPARSRGRRRLHRGHWGETAGRTVAGPQWKPGGRTSRVPVLMSDIDFFLKKNNIWYLNIVLILICNLNVCYCVSAVDGVNVVTIFKPMSSIVVPFLVYNTDISQYHLILIYIYLVGKHAICDFLLEV